MSEINSLLKGIVEFTSEWLEEQQKLYPQRSIDELITEKLEELVLKYIVDNEKQRISDAVKEIRQNLLSETKTE